MDKSKPKLITGGNGYIGSWVVKHLLEEGFTVHLALRDKNKKEKYEHLLKIAETSSGELIVFESDLLIEGSYDEAIKGCDLVFHMASTFLINRIKNPQKQLIDPAYKGTINVLNSVNKTQSVKRVVLTSSAGAIYGNAKDSKNIPHGVFNESIWNTTSNYTNKPYSYAKVLAEKKAWEIHDNQQRWDMVVINPGFVMGPPLSANSNSASMGFMLEMVNGKNKSGVPAMEFGMVDVRDVAKAHMKVANMKEVNGRNIIVSTSISWIKYGEILRDKYGSKYPIPKNLVPKFMLYLVGWISGVSWNCVSKNIGYPLIFDNSKSINELGMEYIPIEKTLIDHLEQIRELGLINK